MVIVWSLCTFLPMNSSDICVLQTEENIFFVWKFDRKMGDLSRIFYFLSYFLLKTSIFFIHYHSITLQNIPPGSCPADFSVLPLIGRER